MSFARILGSQPKSTSRELVVDVIKVTPHATTPTAVGRNAASIARNGVGDYTLTLKGVGRELLGVLCTAEDTAGLATAPGWNAYSSSAKTIDILADETNHETVTVVLFWNNSGITENS